METVLRLSMEVPLVIIQCHITLPHLRTCSQTTTPKDLNLGKKKTEEDQHLDYLTDSSQLSDEVLWNILMRPLDKNLDATLPTDTAITTMKSRHIYPRRENKR